MTPQPKDGYAWAKERGFWSLGQWYVPLKSGDVLHDDDEFKDPDGWRKTREPGREVWDTEVGHYRRPVSARPDAELLEAMFNPEGPFYVHPITGDTHRSTAEAIAWLPALFPEQLVVGRTSDTDKPIYLVSRSKSEDKRLTALGAEFTPSGLSKPEELEGYKPIPAPADDAPGQKQDERFLVDGPYMVKILGEWLPCNWSTERGGWEVPGMDYLVHCCTAECDEIGERLVPASKLAAAEEGEARDHPGAAEGGGV